jgi:Protein of unknown function (DUF1236)
MRYHRNTLLAGLAALAFVAGAGVALAQGTSPPNSADQAAQRAREPMTPGVTKTDRGAQQNLQRRYGATQPYKAQQTRRTALGQYRYDSSARAAAVGTREPTGMQGLQANATGMHAPLTQDERWHIRDTVIHAPGAPRAENVNFGVTVGARIPRGSVAIMPVSPALVGMDPAWRRMSYFVYGDEVVIVNPWTMRIVAVIPT